MKQRTPLVIHRLQYNFNTPGNPQPVVLHVSDRLHAQQIIMDDSKTRPMYEEFLARYQEARNEATKTKLQIAAPVPTGKEKGNGKGEGKDKDSDEENDGIRSSEDDDDDDDEEDAPRAKKGGKKDGGGSDDPVLCAICGPPATSK